MKNLYKYILFLILISVIIVAPFLYLRMSNPSLTLEGDAPYMLYINSKEYPVDSDLFEISLKPGTYILNFVKEYFTSESMELNMERSKDETIQVPFVFEAQMQVTQAAPVAEEAYFTDKCPSKVTSGSGALIYCYNEVQGGNIFEQDSENKLNPVTQITDMPDALLALSPDKTKALLFQVLTDDGKAYTVDLKTGKKEKLWEGENIMSAKFSKDGSKILYERIIGEFMYEMVPVGIVVFDIANKEETVLEQKTRIVKTCLTNNTFFWLDYEIREKINPVESFSDLAEEAKNILTQDNEYIEIPVLKMSEIRSNNEEIVFEFTEEVNDLIIVSCNESRVTFQDYDGSFYQVALEESAMQD